MEGGSPHKKNSKPSFDFPSGVGDGGWGAGSENWLEKSRVGRVEGERSFEAAIGGLKSMGDILKIQIS